MIEQIIEFLDVLHPMSDDLKNALRKRMIVKKCAKGYMLLRRGQVCDHVFFIVKGLVRAYVERDGKERNVWLMMENDIIVAVASFFQRKPSRQFMETLEETILGGISKNSLDELCWQFPEFRIHKDMLLEKYYASTDDDRINLMLCTAEERYQQLIEERPEWINRVPLNQLASFLGMNPSTLSDARRKYWDYFIRKNNAPSQP